MSLEIIGSRKSQAATCLSQSKKLIAEISNTRKLPTVTMCADTNKCYDRVAHPHASLSSQCFGMEIYYLFVLLRPFKL